MGAGDSKARRAAESEANGKGRTGGGGFSAWFGGGEGSDAGASSDGGGATSGGLSGGLSGLDGDGRARANTLTSEIEAEDGVPTVLRWAYGGNRVYVTGSFNDWAERLPLVQSGHDFTTILNLPPGQHHFKFIVDGAWKHSADYTTARDSIGNTNNFIEISRRPFGDESATDLLAGGRVSGSPPGEYGQDFGDLDELVALPGAAAAAAGARGSGRGGADARKADARKAVAGSGGGGSEPTPSEPPLVPPHLMRNILNTTQSLDPGQVPVPHHVSLNHIYQQPLPADPSITVMACTQRHRQKFTTIVYYAPRPDYDGPTHNLISPPMSPTSLYPPPGSISGGGSGGRGTGAAGGFGSSSAGGGRDTGSESSGR